MTIKIKSADEIAKKWGEVTPGRTGYYESGVKGSGTDWEAATKGAAAAYKAAVSAGNIDRLFSGGVTKAGGAKYERKALGVGKDRFASGVSAGVGDMQSGMAPMVETISGLTLPARFPRGSEQNDARGKVVRVALHAKRLALRAAGA